MAADTVYTREADAMCTTVNGLVTRVSKYERKNDARFSYQSKYCEDCWGGLREDLEITKAALG